MNGLSLSDARWFLLIGLFLLPATLVRGQERARESRSVGSFTEVEHAIPGTLHLRQGKETAVAVAAPDGVRTKIETTVDGSTLEIRSADESGVFERWMSDSDLEAEEIEVYVTTPTIAGVTLAGSGRIVGETPLQDQSLSLSVAGSGDMELAVDTKDLHVRVAGSGHCALRGRTSSVTVHIAGSGTLRGRALEAEEADIRIAGSGDAEVHVTERLSAEIFGSGDIRYRGQPTIETSTVGSGEVRPLSTE